VGSGVRLVRPGNGPHFRILGLGWRAGGRPGDPRPGRTQDLLHLRAANTSFLIAAMLRPVALGAHPSPYRGNHGCRFGAGEDNVIEISTTMARRRPRRQLSDALRLLLLSTHHDQRRAVRGPRAGAAR
jgi:hypothetical protein